MIWGIFNKKVGTSRLRMNYRLSLIDNAIIGFKDHMKHFNSNSFTKDDNITFEIYFISKKY